MDAPSRAAEINNYLSLGGIVAFAGQCQNPEAGGPDKCKGAGIFQPEISIRPSQNDEIFVKLGFAKGDGLNEISPFSLVPWAADFKPDIVDINGRNRAHLLTAWYKHTFRYRGKNSIGVTGGIIDSTDYLDDNAYANDEFTQFMNEAFVNASTANLSSYDYGGVVEVNHGPWSLRAVVMNVGANEDGNEYTFFGAQIGYTAQTRFGKGNYRVLVTGTDDAFLDPTGLRQEALTAIILSLDQELGETVGVFFRLGWQDDDAAVTYEAMYTGGFNIKGKIWGRTEDNIGLAYGYLEGGNGDVNATHVAEAYYRLVFGKHLAVTADVQYMRDQLAATGNTDGFIFSLRATAEY